MVAKLIVALLPLLFVGYFVAVYTALYGMFGGTALQHMRRSGAVVYAGFLLGAWIILGRYASPSQLWQVPTNAALWCAIAVIVGVGLFAFELCSSLVLSSLLAGGDRPKAQRLVEGESQAIVESGKLGWGFAAQSVVIVMLEEMVYRGQVLTVIRSEVTNSTVVAVAITGMLFALNHAWFGLRNVALKGVDGVIWGWAVIASGSLLVSIVSHLVFQACVWYRLRMQARRTTGSTESSCERRKLASREPRHTRMHDMGMERLGK